jgi:cytochrome P450
MVSQNGEGAMSDKVEFDPHDPSFVQQGVPFEKLARLRQEQPVYKTPRGAFYLARYEDVEAALTDVDGFHADLGPITGLPGGVPTIPPEQHYLSEILEPRHKSVRRLFAATMATPRLRELEPIIEAECHRLVDAMLAAPVADLHGGYAAAIPALSMAHLMGFERSAADEFMAWSSTGSLMTRPATPGVEPGGPASHVYFRARLAEQRAGTAPPNHLFRQFIDAEIDGQRLSDAEIITQLHFMIQAGVHTTRSLLTHLMNSLVQDDALFAALDANGDAVTNFIEESLRRDSPVQRTTRRTSRDIEVGGVQIPAGSWVEMGIGSANRDESKYQDPDRFALDRPNPRQHLGFGTGSHVCPGAALARLEAVLSVKVLLARVQRLRRVDGATYPPIPGSLGHQPIPAYLEPR